MSDLLNEKILLTVIAACVGATVSLLVQYFLRRKEEKRIRRTVNRYLSDVILPTTITLKQETNSIRTEINKFDHSLSLGNFPVLNSSVLRSFRIDELYPVYGDKVSEIVHIMGILDYLKDDEHKPIFVFNEFIELAEDHINATLDDEEDPYSDEYEHFEKCPFMIELRSRVCDKMNDFDVIFDDLAESIKIVIT
ncbi:MAG: hypothetical protein HWE22_08440 [Flavobacteriales bacterium]|nr:hypothetical protein [Flavobacteriales bacterium]